MGILLTGTHVNNAASLKVQVTNARGIAALSLDIQEGANVLQRGIHVKPRVWLNRCQEQTVPGVAVTRLKSTRTVVISNTSVERLARLVVTTMLAPKYAFFLIPT